MIEKRFLPMLRAIGTHAKEHNLKVWIVGGAVRDFYLKRPTKDFDITVIGDPEILVDFVIKKYGGKKEKFDTFGTFRTDLKNGIKIDFVRARKEEYEHPAALPKVSPGTIEEDLFRRDFTANAWALSLLPADFDTYLDPFEAQKAIDGKYIKILHDKSFVDDPTRMFRALRFAGRFGWTVDDSTSSLLKKAVEDKLPDLLSRERVRQELLKILEEPKVKEIFALMDEYDLTDFIFPRIKFFNSILKTKDVNIRLGVLACGLDKYGGEFLQQLRLKREIYQTLYRAWEVFFSKQAPLKELTKEERLIVTLSQPRLRKTALQPSFITGGELSALGLKGPQITQVHTLLRSLQYKGKIKNKTGAMAEAKKWLPV
ncbi:tRNA nucleotidyltransferase/poly(A) polymerase [Elusimicrobium simillimum]|uniref:hypothetical protein n=1 Tax=Elusimicrobium simillimum TaxID=3143438 RepID=UPI003C6F5B71